MMRPDMVDEIEREIHERIDDIIAFSYQPKARPPPTCSTQTQSTTTIDRSSNCHPGDADDQTDEATQHRARQTC